MNAPAAIKATFADYKRVRTRKLGQLIFEIPLEQLHDAIAALGGEPSVEQDTWVAIARLNETKEPQAEPSEKEKRRFHELPASQQAALTCQREAFWRYIMEEHHVDEIASEEDAAAWVRAFCQVKSRSEIKPETKAEMRWHFLYSAFDAWMQPQ